MRPSFQALLILLPIKWYSTMLLPGSSNCNGLEHSPEVNHELASGMFAAGIGADPGHAMRSGQPISPCANLGNHVLNGTAVVKTKGSGRASDLELGLERIKRYGNPYFKGLEHCYDRKSVLAERDEQGEIRIHVHILALGTTCLELTSSPVTGVEDISWRGLPIVGHAEVEHIGVRDLNGKTNELPVFVWIGDRPKEFRPLASLVRLQVFDFVDVGVTHTTQVGLSFAPESIPRVFDRELCSLLGCPGVEPGELEDEIVKRNSKIVYYFSDDGAKEGRYYRRMLLEADSWNICHGIMIDHQCVFVGYPVGLFECLELADVGFCTHNADVGAR